MSISQSRSRARLADHVRACRVDDQMIFLDLLRSKYIGIGGPQLPALTAAIGLPSSVDDSPATALQAAHLDGCMRRLSELHLLSERPSSQARSRQPRLLEPVASLDTEDAVPAPATDWRHLLRLWKATVVTSGWLRFHSLAYIADRVEALKARHTPPEEHIASRAMRLAAGSYMRLRPFALTTHNRCLYDSLALVHFLATQNLFPQWVIGVRIRPFSAHSWVQSGDIVLNDLPERIRRYQPILIV